MQNLNMIPEITKNDCKFLKNTKIIPHYNCNFQKTRHKIFNFFFILIGRPICNGVPVNCSSKLFSPYRSYWSLNKSRVATISKKSKKNKDMENQLKLTNLQYYIILRMYKMSIMGH